MNNRIKGIYIKGFKKFADFKVTFDPNLNILVGENEAGKSTVLDALKLVLCQDYRNADKSYIYDLLNRDQIKLFQSKKTIDTLPLIKIILELELSEDTPNAQDFFGEVHELRSDDGNMRSRYGITFDCKFDEEYADLLSSEISEGVIPIEYYSLKWTTFAGQAYALTRKPLGFLSIDNSECRGIGAINFFSRDLFLSTYDLPVRMRAKNDFREKMRRIFDGIGLERLKDGRHFALNDKKLSLEGLLSVAEDDGILLENRGRGCENLIKTMVAFEKARTPVDVVTMEEPENHLSFTNMRQMIREIETRPNGCQLIVATHSNMIVSRLGVKNILWISNAREALKLDHVDASDEKFFAKADTTRLLDFILAHKVILVEGPTEYMLIPMFVKQLTNKDSDEHNLAIITCGGLSYKRYLRLAEVCDKRVAVITDNDGEQKKVDEIASYNSTHEEQHIFVPQDISLLTWEFCVHKQNADILDHQFPAAPNAQYVFRGKSYPNTLGYMLTHKTEVVYQMLVRGKENEYVPPNYVKDAIEWVLK